MYYKLLDHADISLFVFGMVCENEIICCWDLCNVEENDVITPSHQVGDHI